VPRGRPRGPGHSRAVRGSTVTHGVASRRLVGYCRREILQDIAELLLDRELRGRIVGCNGSVSCAKKRR
jgi:hypothetical protein